MIFEMENADGKTVRFAQNEIITVKSTRAVCETLQVLLGEDKQIFAVTDSNVARLHPEILPDCPTYVLEPGEDNKTLASVENICRKMREAGMTRHCAVVAFGGGVVGDVAGFAAAVYMRGVDFVNVPTTLLSQVDSAIGGKTGVNLDGYKNMIGAFKMPCYILICPEVLNTLPEREWRCGMGELIKTAFLDDSLYAFVKENISALCSRDPAATERAVTDSARFKKKITDEDPKETGKRVILNLGHTVGHALEKCDGHRLSHGEYVLLGMKIELEMTRDEYLSDPDFINEAGELLAAAGLPRLPKISAEDIASAAQSDKKNGTAEHIVILGLNSSEAVFKCGYSKERFTELYIEAVSKLVQNGELKFE